MTQRSERFLVRCVNWLGDAVMMTPALLRLRERFPKTHIALLSPEKLRDLWFHHPAVNEIISFAASEGVLSVSRKLRAGNFDLALVLPNSPRSAMEVWLAGIPKRVGYTGNWRGWFLTQPISQRPGAVSMRKRSIREIRRLVANAGSDPAIGHRPSAIGNISAHHIHQYLHLAAALGANPGPLAPQLFVTPEEVEATRKKFGLTETAQPTFGLSPGAEYGPAKRWPRESFVAAAREIQQRTNCFWIILGSQSDAPLAGEIQSAIGNRQSAILNLAGKTSLRELMSLLKVCRGLLTNDSGPMHVAAALGTPVVVPFGSTSPELTGPGLPGDSRHRLLCSHVPCSPCFLRECPIDFRCMTGISVEQVAEAMSQVVSANSPSG